MLNDAAPVLVGWTLLDRATQAWVRRTGRRVDLAEHPWLDGPVGGETVIGEEWIAAHARTLGATLSRAPEAGLLRSFATLDGPGFSSNQLHPEVVDFYERTARWRLELWSRWSPLLRPGGMLVASLFARRLQQLNLPTDPLAASRGITSAVLPMTAGDGRVLGTVWQRTLRATGETLFGGFYGVTRLPLTRRPSIRVVFPLPNGSLSVFLRPEQGPGGALRLHSPPGRFGEDGAYLLVRSAGSGLGPQDSVAGALRRVRGRGGRPARRPSAPSRARRAAALPLPHGARGRRLSRGLAISSRWRMRAGRRQAADGPAPR